MGLLPGVTPVTQAFSEFPVYFGIVHQDVFTHATVVFAEFALQVRIDVPSINEQQINFRNRTGGAVVALETQTDPAILSYLLHLLDFGNIFYIHAEELLRFAVVLQ